MARIEIMMEALIRERGMTMSANQELEHDRRSKDSATNNRAFAAPLLDPALAEIGQPSHDVAPLPSFKSLLPFGQQPPGHIHLGEKYFPFPATKQHDQYMARFFGDIHLRYPCLDYYDFLKQTQQLTQLGREEHKVFLALSYMIFACCDIMYDAIGPNSTDPTPAGWKWYMYADSILNKNLFLSGCDDITFVQFLLFQVCLIHHFLVSSYLHTT